MAKNLEFSGRAVRPVLFIGGVLVYLWFLSRKVSGFLPPVSKLPSGMAVALAIAAALLAGGSLMYAMSRVLKRAPGSGSRRVLLASMGYGVLGIVVPTLVYCLLGAFLQSLWIASAAPRGSEALSFPLAIMSASLYAMGPAIASIRFGLLYGILAGVFLLLVGPWEAAAVAVLPDPARTTKWSLGVAIAALTTALVPLVGFLLAIWALFLGIKALRGLRRAGSQETKLAVISVVIASVCLAWVAFSFAVYAGIELGWIHHDTVPR